MSASNSSPSPTATTTRARPAPTPLIELSNAALDTLEKYISYPAEDFSKEIAKHFGFTRVTQKTAQLCEAGVQHLIAEQTILLEDGSYKIVD